MNSVERGAPASIAGDEKRRRRLGIRTWTYVPPRADVLGSAGTRRSASGIGSSSGRVANSERRSSRATSRASELVVSCTGTCDAVDAGRQRLSPSCNGSRTLSSRRAASRSSPPPFSVRTTVCRDGRGLTAPSAGQNRRRGQSLGSRSATRWASCRRAPARASGMANLYCRIVCAPAAGGTTETRTSSTRTCPRISPRQRSLCWRSRIARMRPS